MGSPFSKGDIVRGEWVNCYDVKRVEILSVQQKDCSVTLTFASTNKTINISRQPRTEFCNPVPYASRKWTVDNDGKPVLRE